MHGNIFKNISSSVIYRISDLRRIIPTCISKQFKFTVICPSSLNNSQIFNCYSKNRFRRKPNSSIPGYNFTTVTVFLNLFLLLGVLSIMGATLTLPGIAGIILTIGMAVDANVLIFERMREEVKNGRSTRDAAEAGFNEAWSTIVDSNLTTLVAAFVLLYFGTGPVRGFAVTLAIGIATSMFTSVTVTRLIITGWLNKYKPTKLPI